jgi:hypothetical protein
MYISQWLADDTPHFVPDPESPSGGPTDLLPHVKRAFNAKQLCMSSISSRGRHHKLIAMHVFREKSCIQHQGGE